MINDYLKMGQQKEMSKLVFGLIGIGIFMMILSKLAEEKK